jgi:site-specific DNA recombinase
VTWNRTRKRNQWGIHKQAPRPASDWLERLSPELQIVSEDVWEAAHARIAAARGIYLKGTKGQAFGRPALGNPSKYLLTNLTLCGECGGGLRVRSRSHGTERKFFYGCTGHHERGTTVCTNNADVPMADANEIVIEALLDDVLDEDIVNDSIDEALRLLQGDDEHEFDRLKTLEALIAKVEKERDRLVTAIATGGQLEGLLEALRARESQRATLEAERTALRSATRLRASDVARVRGELHVIADDWRHVLADDPTNARPIVSSLLVGRVTITPTSRTKEWTLSGEGTLVGLFERAIVPTIYPSVVRPQREWHPSGHPVYPRVSGSMIAA